MKRYLWGTAYKFTPSTPDDNVMLNVTASKELSMNAQHIIEQHFSSGQPLSLPERQIIYNDPAMRLAPHELLDLNNLQNFPVCENHNTQRVVGRIIDGFMHQNEFKILAEVTDPQTIQKIDSQEYTGLSVGYSRTKRGSEMDGLQFREVSVCKTPFFNDCNIAVSAMKDQEGQPKILEGSIKMDTTPPGSAPAPNQTAPAQPPAQPPVTPAQPPATPPSTARSISPDEFRALSEKYESLKRMEDDYQRIITEQREAQKPIIEKTIINLARVTGNIDPSNTQNPLKFSPDLQSFLVNQFSDSKNKEMANFLTTVSSRFEEAGTKYETLQAQTTGFQQQNSELQRQNAELKALLDKQNQLLSDQQKQQSKQQQQNTMPPLMTDLFQRMKESSPIDSLFGNVTNKRSFEKMMTPPLAATPPPKEVDHVASRDLPDDEPANKKQKTEAAGPPGIPQSHARFFNSVMGIKHNVNMRDPFKFAPKQ